MWHIGFHHHDGYFESKLPLSIRRCRWQIVSDEHIDTIQALEQSVEKLRHKYIRCLLCRPSVGGALYYRKIEGHFVDW